MKKVGIVIAVIVIIALIVVGIVFANKQSTEQTVSSEQGNKTSQEASNTETQDILF